MLEMRSMASFIVWLRGVCARGRWCINSCYPGDAYNPQWTTQRWDADSARV